MQIPLDKIKMDKEGFLRIDGHAPFKIINTNNSITIEFCDNDRLRSSCRGDRLLSVSLEDLISRIKDLLGVDPNV